MIHNEDSKETVWIFDARISHFHKDIGIFLEVDHQFLLLLHVSKLILIHHVCVVEEKVIFAGQFYFDLVDLVYSLCA